MEDPFDKRRASVSDDAKSRHEVAVADCRTLSDIACRNTIRKYTSCRLSTLIAAASDLFCSHVVVVTSDVASGNALAELMVIVRAETTTAQGI